MFLLSFPLKASLVGNERTVAVLSSAFAIFVCFNVRLVYCGSYATIMRYSLEMAGQPRTSPLRRRTGKNAAKTGARQNK